MKESTDFQIYAGEGKSFPDIKLEIPTFTESPLLNDPRLYIAKKGLRDAVNIALLLGQPLLVTGEPGTGKTQLAYSVAQELGDLPVHRFDTKSTSTAKDLFYHYDALRHFHDAQFRRFRTDQILAGENAPKEQKALTAEPYVNFEALGLAILLSLAKDDPQRAHVNQYLPEKFRNLYDARSVVLIDEIDKAPRDLPNDILNEIEEMSFEIKETNLPPFAAAGKNRPIVILTSNSEKNLPDAFLRRCVFYHIEFPTLKELENIVEKRLGESSSEIPFNLRINAIRHFENIRSIKLKKAPATAELLGWIRVLEHLNLDVANEDADEEALIFTYSILTKNREDNLKVIERFHPHYKRYEDFEDTDA